MRFCVRLRASKFGRYPRILAAFITSSGFLGWMKPRGKCRETVHLETPASNATSLAVAFCRLGRSLGFNVPDKKHPIERKIQQDKIRSTKRAAFSRPRRENAARYH
jgi:hypothetical protein